MWPRANHCARSLLLGALHLAGCCLALRSSSTRLRPTSTSTNSPPVPTGTAIVGDYAGQYRPQVHFSPPQHFMNDPNGMFRDANGTWHLYYQYNPSAIVAGNQHWGHATSTDLYYWVNQPIALFPPKKGWGIFSGSCVVDVNNTSGFFPNQTNGVIAIYTLNEVYENKTAGPQTQCLAYSRDGGYTFTTYEHNPIIDSTSTQFRDPKVTWYEDHWVLVVAWPYEFTIGIFTSPNLIDWTHASNFSNAGMLGLQWECPNLMNMPYYDYEGHYKEHVWTMFVSINPGAPLGGSVMEYYPGTFNGTHFKSVDAAARWADFGKDNYAGHFFYGLSYEENPVFIAWASNWQYAQFTPTGREHWRSVMTLPRQTRLTKTERVGWKLINTPYFIQPILGETLASEKDHRNGTIMVDYSQVESNAIFFEANVTGIPKHNISDNATLNFTALSPVSGEYVRGGYFFGGDVPFYLDRGGAKAFDQVFFTDKFSINVLSQNGTWQLRGLIDRSIIEVFLNGGTDSGTALFFSEQPLTLLLITTANLPETVRVSIRVDAIDGGWSKMESEDGLVYGNQTKAATGSVNSKSLLLGGL